MATNKWIVFDVTQYTRKSWINRNRILHPKKGWQYVSVPLVSSSTQMKIHEAKVSAPHVLKQSMLGKLSHYSKRAPYYDAVLKLVNQAFDQASDNSLTSLNIAGLSVVCSYLNIPFNYSICSKLGLNFPNEMEAGSWAPFIAKSLGATCYINPIGGYQLFRLSDFKDHGINLKFARFDEFTYPTQGYVFVPSLSILDVLMWNAPQKVRYSAINLNHLLTYETAEKCHFSK
jgi:hypothetical protein